MQPNEDPDKSVVVTGILNGRMEEWNPWLRVSWARRDKLEDSKPMGITSRCFRTPGVRQHCDSTSSGGKIL